MSNLSLPNNDYLRLSIAGAIAFVFLGLFLGSFFPPYGFFLIAFAPLALTARSGVELDLAAARYRKYSSFAGMRSGEWKTYSPAHQLVLLQKRGSKTIVSVRLNSETDVTGSFYELYIMDPSHTRRLYLYSTKDRAKIQAYIQQITAHSTLQLVPFNPASRR